MAKKPIDNSKTKQVNLKFSETEWFALEKYRASLGVHSLKTTGAAKEAIISTLIEKGFLDEPSSDDE